MTGACRGLQAAARRCLRQHKKPNGPHSGRHLNASAPPLSLTIYPIPENPRSGPATPPTKPTVLPIQISMDPLSIISGSITLYAALLQLKKLSDSVRDVPEVIVSLQHDVDETLKILLHSKAIIKRLDDLGDPGPFSTVNIRDELRKNISCLQPDIESLRRDLAGLDHAPQNNLDQWTNRFRQIRQMPRLTETHARIAERLRWFETLRQALNA